tara:strand:- start:2405 stop:3760 length:1356 start_codon:yes stop_codon:yes gene_type:complete
MFAILDIETTGGKFNEEAITEIAIYRYDQGRVIDQFISLVQADRPIQPFVQGLTGINNRMLKNSPKFFEIAKRIIEITNESILVAHNAEFDYRILRTEFSRLGYNFKRKSLCTVKLSKELIPNIKSYKLGNLVKSLGIPINNRHRAQGDALATLKLFELLIQKDVKKIILNSLIIDHYPKNEKNKFIKIIDNVPNVTGVYYVHDKKGIIYIGKSKNLKRRVTTHLTSNSSKAIKIQNQVFKISYEHTGSELLALLKEQEEIKENQPILNYRSKYRLFPIGLKIVNINGYNILKIEQIKSNEEYMFRFKNKINATKKIEFLIKEYNLCENLTFLSNKKQTCVQYEFKNCFGACCSEEKPISYNVRVQKLISHFKINIKSFIMIDSGRKIDEKSFVYVQDNIIQGYGYYELNHQIKSPDKIKNRLVKINHNQDAYTILHNYIKAKKNHALIEL